MNFPEPSHITAGPHGWPWFEETDRNIYSAHEYWPKISIITASYNQGKFLEQTIRSVLLQNYPDPEFIIIDGASTDNSVEVIKKYDAWIKYWVSEPDAGQSDALNKGLKLATGEIIAWINSDDFYEKDAFFKIASIYMQSPFEFLCGACEMIDLQGKRIQRLFTKKITHNTLIKYWKPHFCPPQPSIFLQKKILDELGHFNTDLKYAMDFDIWLRASKKYRFTIIDENISYYRVHTESKTGSEGGMRKFIPEWKMLIKKSLGQKSFFRRVNFIFLESIFKLRKAKNNFINRYEPKNIMRRWLITKKA